MSERLATEKEAHVQPDDRWLQENWGDFIKHPREIVKSATPLSEFYEKPYNGGGVYFLLTEDRIAYVGMSENSVKTRIECHVKKLQFDAVSIIPLPCSGGHILMVESLYIGWFRPWFNGKLQAVPTIFSEVPVNLTNISGPTESYIYQGGDKSIDSRRTVSRTLASKLHAIDGCEQAQDKAAASFRLSSSCIDLLKKLAAEKGISQAAVIELAIRAEAKKHART